MKSSQVYFQLRRRSFVSRTFALQEAESVDVKMCPSACSAVPKKAVVRTLMAAFYEGSFFCLMDVQYGEKSDMWPERMK